MSDISLTASMRTNLLSLQNTQSLMDQTQERLSTGKKVNSAIDNPSSYYTAQSLSNRASDLDSLLDSMGQGIQTIKAANEGIESITAFVQQAKAVANTARDTSGAVKIEASEEYANTGGDVTVKIGKNEFNVNIGASSAIDAAIGTLNDTSASVTAVGNTGLTLKQALSDANLTFTKSADGKKLILSEVASPAKPTEKVEVSVSSTIKGVSLSGTINPDARETSIKQYNEIIDQINQLANDASYKGVNLLKGDDLKVIFNEDRSSYIEVKGTDLTAAGLGLKEIDKAAWGTNQGVDDTITAIEAAVTRLRDVASEFGNNYSIVQTRQDFTENLINVLEEGADDLTLADMNEESANMLALQTRQQLGINSLSLASQAAQSVLQLF